MDLMLLAEFSIPGIITACVIGGICGFLAGQIMKGRGLGIVGNIVVGVVGAFLFGSLFSFINLGLGALVQQIVGGTLGAVVLLFIIGLVKKNVKV